MPDDVQIELAANRIAEIDVGREDRLLVVHGPRDDLAKRVHDAASTSRYDGVRRIRDIARVVGGIIASPRELVAAQDEAAPFECDVTHAGEPTIATVGGRR